MSEFNKANLAKIRFELNALLENYGTKNGMKFELGNIKFQASEFSVTMKASVIGAKTSADKFLIQMMDIYGLKRTGFDSRVLVSYNPRAKTMPFIYSQRGQNFKCTLDAAKRYFV